MKNMEYLGAFRNRRVDKKRRFVVPNALIELIGDENVIFVLSNLNQEKILPLKGPLYLYTKKEWKIACNELTDFEQKLNFIRRSLDSTICKKTNRLTLPPYFNCKSVDIVGMGDYVVIVDSDYGRGLMSLLFKQTFFK